MRPRRCIIEMSRNAPGDTGRMVAPLVGLSLFFAAALGALSFGLWVADQAVLRLVYGSEEVGRLGLRIIAVKPDVKVSNGDTLGEGWCFRHWAVSAIVWLPSTVGFFLGLRRLMPADYRELADLRGPTEELPKLPIYVSVGCVLALLALILAFIRLGLGRGSALLAAAALSVAWVAFWRGGRSAE